MASVIAVSTRLSRAVPDRVTTYCYAAVIVILLVVLYTATLGDLAVEWWTQPEASHGLLIPPLAMYLAFMRRRSTLSIEAKPEWGGVWISAAGCILYLLGRMSAEFFLTRVSIVVVLAGLTCTFWGRKRLRTLGFPFILLATMVPLPGIVYNSLAAPLQLFASTIATELSQLLGVSIYREGNIIHLSGVSLGVAEACSGLHSLSALLVGSLLLGFIEDGWVGGRVLLVLLSVPLAIAVNVVRVTGTAILADVRLDFAMGFYHAFSGWLVFILGFGCLWLLAKAILRPEPEKR
jgi:exosortase